MYVQEAQESIGEGAFSTVLKAIHHHGEPKEFAVKKMLAQTKELNQIARIEVDSYRRFRHKNILSLIDSTVCVQNGFTTFYLLFPYMEYGSLRDVLNNIMDGKASRPTLAQVLASFVDVCDAINLLHNHDPSYVHQDIKPEVCIADLRVCVLVSWAVRV